MNMLVTIFGGMMLTAALYAGMRLMRAGNFWASVAAGGLPSLAYLAYAVAAWPGLDAVAMHLVAYPTVSVVLSQLYDTNKAQGLHWAPKLIVALFLLASTIFGGLVYIASNGLPNSVAQWVLPDAKGKNVHTAFAGVVPHYEEAAKTIGHHMKFEERLNQLGWKVEVSGLGQLDSNRPTEVAVYLKQRDGRGLDDAKVVLALATPGKPHAGGLALTGAGASGYRGQVHPAEKGVWVAYLDIEALGERIALEHTIEVR